MTETKMTHGERKLAGLPYVAKTADGMHAVCQVAPNGAEQIVAGPWRERRNAVEWLKGIASK